MLDFFHSVVVSAAMGELLMWGGIMAVMLYVVAPALVMRRQSISMSPRYSLVMEDDPLLTAAVREFIANDTAAMIESGFEFLAYLKTQTPGRNASAFVALLADDGTGRLAQIAFVTAHSAGGLVTNKKMGVILETHYEDGFKVQSSTFPETGVFVGRPNVVGVSFHGLITNISELLRMHHVLNGKIGHGKVCPSGASRDPAGYMIRLHEEVMRFQAERGRYRLVEGGSVYRPTLVGAYVMTWKLLFPWKQVIRARGWGKGRYWMRKLAR